MKRYRKLISFMLVVSLLVAFSITTFATGEEGQAISIVTENGNVTIYEELKDTDGNVYMQISQIGSAMYYYENTDEYTLVITLGEENYTEVALKYSKDSDVFYTSMNPAVDKADEDSKSISSSEKIKSFELIKRDVLEGSIKLNEEQIEQAIAPIAPMASDADRIMAALYSAGWPTPYTNILRAQKTQNGATAKLYHSCTYSYSQYWNYLAIATTTVGTVAALLGLAPVTVLTIVSAVAAGGGVYVLVQDVLLKKYNTYAYGTKTVYVNDTYQYYAGRTVRWIAIVGDIGATLQFQSENKHYDYDDNNSLLDTGLWNYFNL